MSDVSDDIMTAIAPRYTRRLSDKILIAFHHACDQADFEVAELLLQVVETLISSPRLRRAPRGSERRRHQEALVAAHERLWQLRHPDDRRDLNLPSFGDDRRPLERDGRAWLERAKWGHGPAR